MFERYTERARRVLFFARYEASQFGSLSIDTEHLLLGLLREGEGITSRIFAGSHLSLKEIRKEVEGRVVFQEKVPTSLEIPFSAETKRVLQYAMQEADRLLHDHIGTEHLLLGILNEEKSVAASILEAHGMRLDAVRAHVVQLLNESSTPLRAHYGGKPDVPPSYEVHISPSRRQEKGVSADGGREHWIALGFTLKAIIVQVYGFSDSRIDFPAELDDGERYDFVMVLPQEESRETIDRLVQEAITTQFGLTITEEIRPADVYVLTAPHGEGPALHAAPEGRAGATLTWRAESSGASIDSIGASGSPIGDLCRVLEEALGRAFVDETGLKGAYDFEVQSGGHNAGPLGVFDTFDIGDVFLRALRDQLGLVATPGQRDVSMLVVRRHQ